MKEGFAALICNMGAMMHPAPIGNVVQMWHDPIYISPITY